MKVEKVAGKNNSFISHVCLSKKPGHGVVVAGGNPCRLSGIVGRGHWGRSGMRTGREGDEIRRDVK